MLATACGAGTVLPDEVGGSAALSGAGATFPAPLYQRWADEYRKFTDAQADRSPPPGAG